MAQKGQKSELFPSGNNIGVELFYSGAWQDVTADLSDEGWQITRSARDPQQASFNLTNSTGKYSPRNPDSPLYGLIGRNTPVRVWVDNGAGGLSMSGASGSSTTPDTASLDITGDLDIRWDGELASWRVRTDLMGKWATTGNQRSWTLMAMEDGTVALFVSANGSIFTGLQTTRKIPVTWQRVRLRVTLDVNDGSGNKVARFYTGPSLDGPWTLLETVTSAGTTTLFNSSAPLRLGKNPETSAGTQAQTVYEARLYNGIDGTLVANPVPVVDSTGKTWTVGAGGVHSRRNYRFTGVVSEWPIQWRKTGAQSVIATPECAGALRRLGQGASPVVSPARLTYPTVASLVAYWPMEDARYADQIAPGLPGLVPGWVSNSPELSARDIFPSSLALPSLGRGELYFRVPGRTPTGACQIRFYLSIPDSVADGTVLARVNLTSSFSFCDLIYGTGRTLTLKGYVPGSPDPVLAVTTGTFTAEYTRGPLLVSIELEQVGPNTKAKLVLWSLDVPIANYYEATTPGGTTLGAVGGVNFNPNQSDCGDTVVGQLLVQNAITSVFEAAAVYTAYRGAEVHANRFVRLCTENNEPYTIVGGGGRSLAAGYQPIIPLVDILRESAESDFAALTESRDENKLLYRTLASMSGVEPALSIVYTDNLLMPFHPTDDDKNTRNEITVQRVDGAATTVRDSTSPLGVPSIGLYDDAVTLNPQWDETCVHLGGILLARGTVDSERWPQIGVDLFHPLIRADQKLTRDLLLVDIGDRISITNLPDWLPPFPVDQIVTGYSEIIEPFSHKIVFSCEPYEPYKTGYWGHPVGRWTNGTSTLSAGVTTTATSWTITRQAGTPRWTTTASDYPLDFMVGPELVRVTAVTGTGATQTFTVVRSINGVVRAHAAGQSIRLVQNPRWGL